ncbi:His/Gly/Thr/Pro-type tRNA ligase C-terminal domain-containing protein [Halocatena marina]|uniref:His/Gly/Thr/Pro-type tRNA ligase C-terminal domain-containing protein n=2 Tax=Halocatena marina TaxID=2934937 RepID=A0ABD5YI27_9EURY
METPRLPTWLSPTQVRFIPVSDEHVQHCDELVDRLGEATIRADVDDRHESVGKRIARAETDWVPYYAVVGDREQSSEEYGVNIRSQDEERTMTLDELRNTVRADIHELPDRNRYLPQHLSNHPRFVGH